MKTLVLSALTVFACAIASSGHAQDYDSRADQKVMNGYRVHSATTYYSNAIGHAEALESYANEKTGISPETAKEHVNGVRQYVNASSKELAKLEATTRSDKEAQALIAGIKTHQGHAMESCNMVESECVKQRIDGVVLASCCTNMSKELKAADALHDKLLKHLKIVPATK